MTNETIKNIVRPALSSNLDARKISMDSDGNGGYVLSNIICQYTGEPMTLKSYTGTPVVDNVVYFQFDGEYYKRTGSYTPQHFGAVADGVADDHAALTGLIAVTPSAGKIVLPQGNYAISETLVIDKPIQICGTGSAHHAATQITPLAGFDSASPLIKITSGLGRSTIRDIRSDCNSRCATWLQFDGPGDQIFIERNRVEELGAGGWFIFFNNGSTITNVGTTEDEEYNTNVGYIHGNGVYGVNISENFFYNTQGGGIYMFGGGDSCTLFHNTLQLVNSPSHAVKWHSVLGASKLLMLDNNMTGAAKGVEVWHAQGVNILSNQFEATIPMTNEHKSMITLGAYVGSSCIGAQVSNNNMNCHSSVDPENPNAHVGVYMNDVLNGYIMNNEIIAAVNPIYIDSGARRITYFPGYDYTYNGSAYAVNDIYDAGTNVSTIRANGVSQWHGSHRFFGTNNSGIQFGALNNVTALLRIDAPDAGVTTAQMRLFQLTPTTAATSMDTYYGNSIQHSFNNHNHSYMQMLAGYLGIGTTTPQNKLHIHDGSSPQLRLSYSTTRYFLVYCDSAGGGVLSPQNEVVAGDSNAAGASMNIRTGLGTGNALAAINFLVGIPTGVATDLQTYEQKMILNHNGLGIGITPLAPLHFRTTSGDEVIRFASIADSTITHNITCNFSSIPASNYYSLKVCTGTPSTQVEVLRLIGNGNAAIPNGSLVIGGTAPNANAILDLQSTSKPFMEPRMTTTQRDAVSSPAEGMEVCNTTTHAPNFYNGSAWTNVLLGVDVVVDKTITAGGTTGAQTINKPAGQVNFAAGQSTLVVTNSLVTTSSQIFVTVYGTDATATSARVTKANGSFTITLNASATAETAVGFFVVN